MNSDTSDQLSRYLADLAANEPQILPEVVLMLIQARLMAEAMGRLTNGLVTQLAALEDKLTE
jgi:hypothetical protein